MVTVGNDDVLGKIVNLIKGHRSWSAGWNRWGNFWWCELLACLGTLEPFGNSVVDYFYQATIARVYVLVVVLSKHAGMHSLFVANCTSIYKLQ